MELPRTSMDQYGKLKQLGFPINTTSKHPTPTIAFVMKWLRDEKSFRYGINWHWRRLNDFQEEWFSFTLYSRNKDGGFEEQDRHSTYEEAESALIDFITEALIKKQKT